MALPDGTTLRNVLRYCDYRTRSFRMGAIPVWYDDTQAAIDDANAFQRRGDIANIHVEGVPWAEMVAETDFPAEFVDVLNTLKQSIPSGGKVYLEISPGRGGANPLQVLALKNPVASGYYDPIPDLPASLDGKHYGSPEVQAPYLRYCQMMIEFFNPDYLAIGIETNSVIGSANDPVDSGWEPWSTLYNATRNALKVTYPDLPIAQSIVLNFMYDQWANTAFDQPGFLDEFFTTADLDFVPISHFPAFMSAGTQDDRLVAFQWLKDLIDAYDHDLPYAFSELSDSDELLTWDSGTKTVYGDPADQQAFFEYALKFAEDNNFIFATAWGHHDYDVWWAANSGDFPEQLGTWRYHGLINENEEKKPAYYSWDRFIQRGLSPSVAAFAGTVANDAAAGTQAWGDPTDSQGNNSDFANNANVFFASTTTSNYLKFTNFGFAIPDGKIIKSINVSAWACQGSIVTTTAISNVKLVKAGTVVGTDLNSSSRVLNNAGNVSPDALSDFLEYSFSGFGGQSFTADDVNDSGFGFALQCSGDKIGAAYILKGRVTVVYE
jgi:hypothetical protein